MTAGRTGGQGVPGHLSEAATELDALALRLLPDVLDLAERYERLDWESTKVGWDLACPGVPYGAGDGLQSSVEVEFDELPEGRTVSRAMSVASAAMDAMRLRLHDAHGDVTTPWAFDDVLRDACPE